MVEPINQLCTIIWRIDIDWSSLFFCVYIYICVYIYVRVYICVYIHIYVYINILAICMYI